MRHDLNRSVSRKTSRGGREGGVTIEGPGSNERTFLLRQWRLKQKNGFIITSVRGRIVNASIHQSPLRSRLSSRTDGSHEKGQTLQSTKSPFVSFPLGTIANRKFSSLYGRVLIGSLREIPRDRCRGKRCRLIVSTTRFLSSLFLYSRQDQFRFVSIQRSRWKTNKRSTRIRVKRTRKPNEKARDIRITFFSRSIVEMKWLRAQLESKKKDRISENKRILINMRQSRVYFHGKIQSSYQCQEKVENTKVCFM